MWHRKPRAEKNAQPDAQKKFAPVRVQQGRSFITLAIVGGCGSYRETGRQNHEEREIVFSEERLDLDVVDDEINFLETRHPPRRLPEYSSLKAARGRQAAKAQTRLPVSDREQPAPHTSARQSLGLSYPLQHHLHARFCRRPPLECEQGLH